MAERQQPDIADQQVEGAGEERKAQRLHQEDRVEDERRDQRQGEQDRRQDPVPPAAFAPSQRARPKKPAGLTSNTRAMIDKDHGARRLRVEHLGQPLDQPQREAADDRAEDRAHAADHDDRKDGDDDVRPHQRADLVDRRRHDAGERRQRDAGPVGQRDHPRHVDAEGLDQDRVLGRRPQIGAEPGALDREPGREAHDERGDDDPGAIVRQKHEAEITAALQLGRDRVGLA